MAKAILKKGEGRLLKRGGLWIFDNEIDRIDGEFLNGDLISVEDFDGYPMGVGVINLNSKIRIRMLSRNSEEVIDDAFWEKRVRDAVEYRLKTVDTSCCRLIFGEADYLPGFVVDKYADILVIALSCDIEPDRDFMLSGYVFVIYIERRQVAGIPAAALGPVVERYCTDRFGIIIQIYLSVYQSTFFRYALHADPGDRVSCEVELACDLHPPVPQFGYRSLDQGAVAVRLFAYCGPIHTFFQDQRVLISQPRKVSF